MIMGIFVRIVNHCGVVLKVRVAAVEVTTMEAGRIRAAAVPTVTTIRIRHTSGLVGLTGVLLQETGASASGNGRSAGGPCATSRA